MKPAEHPTALRIRRLLSEAGRDNRVVEFEQPTRAGAEAAAGTPFSVSHLTPEELAAITGAEWADIRQEG